MDDVISGSIKVPSNAEIGDQVKYDKQSLKAYALESKLKRVVTLNEKTIKEHLKTKFKIPETIRVRLEDKTTKVNYEEFDIIEVIKLKLIDFNSKNIIRLWNIYEERGIPALINAIHYLSPIQKI